MIVTLTGGNKLWHVSLSVNYRVGITGQYTFLNTGSNGHYYPNGRIATALVALLNRCANS